MRMSRLFLSTRFETPKDAELKSHRLMLKAGLIRKLCAGIYSYLPLGYRVLLKIEGIVREEMNSIGGQEVLLPTLHPVSLWQETGRWVEYGDDMFKVKDRAQSLFGLGPTHEEIITDLIRKEVHSYRELPLLLYQIQTKFRDEIRPRFGVMRSREFLMKDAYSFHLTKESLDETYKKVYDAYCRIFKRCGLKVVVVEAESGLIGGDVSHEFMVEADAGEDIIVICTSCSYATNLEKASSGDRKALKDEDEEERELRLIETPNVRTTEEVSSFLGISPESLIKTLIYQTENGAVGVLILGSQTINETKLKKVLGSRELSLADENTVEKLTHAKVGFSGPIGLDIKLIADKSLRGRKNFVVGANKTDAHYIGANIGRDFNVYAFEDIKMVEDGDPCPLCNSPLRLKRGIEVGHVFKLGTKYSEAMGATVTDQRGQLSFLVMGTYGIGISRIVAAVIESLSDERGIVWPLSIAPYQVLVLPVNVTDRIQISLAEEIYSKLIEEGIETILDDRDESPGRKFNDADLIGFPIRITVGKKAKDGNVEVYLRQTKVSYLESKERVVEAVKSIIMSELSKEVG